MELTAPSSQKGCIHSMVPQILMVLLAVLRVAALGTGHRVCT